MPKGFYLGATSVTSLNFLRRKMHQFNVTGLKNVPFNALHPIASHHVREG